MVPVENVSIVSHDPSFVSFVRAGGGGGTRHGSNNASAADIVVDSATCWAVPRCLQQQQQQQQSSSLTLQLAAPQLVGALQLQGGGTSGEQKSNGGGGGSGGGDAAAALRSSSGNTYLSQQQGRSRPPPQSASSSDSSIAISNIVLPCGVSLASVESSYELTAIVLADVLDWSALIKSNPPEKFLKRPPVRFLFDLVRFLGANNPGFLNPVPALAEADWAVVGADKLSKLEFMEKVKFLVFLGWFYVIYTFDYCLSLSYQPN